MGGAALTTPREATPATAPQAFPASTARRRWTPAVPRPVPMVRSAHGGLVTGSHLTSGQARGFASHLELTEPLNLNTGTLCRDVEGESGGRAQSSLGSHAPACLGAGPAAQAACHPPASHLVWREAHPCTVAQVAVLCWRVCGEVCVGHPKHLTGRAAGPRQAGLSGSFQSFTLRTALGASRWRRHVSRSDVEPSCGHALVLWTGEARCATLSSSGLCEDTALLLPSHPAPSWARLCDLVPRWAAVGRREAGGVCTCPTQRSRSGATSGVVISHGASGSPVDLREESGSLP